MGLTLDNHRLVGNLKMMDHAGEAIANLNHGHRKSKAMSCSAWRAIPIGWYRATHSCAEKTKHTGVEKTTVNHWSSPWPTATVPSVSCWLVSPVPLNSWCRITSETHLKIGRMQPCYGCRYPLRRCIWPAAVNLDLEMFLRAGETLHPQPTQAGVTVINKRTWPKKSHMLLLNFRCVFFCGDHQ